MRDINMTKLAKERGGENWLEYMDTYSEVDEEELIEYTEKGFELWQKVDHNNQHRYFYWAQDGFGGGTEFPPFAYPMWCVLQYKQGINSREGKQLC